MKRIKNLSESNFLKLFFIFLSLAFLVGAVCMPDRGEMFSGLWKIVSNPSKISTNYFAIGGFAATFLNVGLVCAICTAFYFLPGAEAYCRSSLAFLLTAGFSAWGINVLNIWPTFLGVAIYCLVMKQKLAVNVNAMLFSTGIAPLVTELMLRYPGETVGFTPAGIALSIFIGVFIGFLLPGGLVFSPKLHRGFDLYSAALPVGMTAFFLQGVLYKATGVALPAAPAAETLLISTRLGANVFCCVVFGVCIVAALLLGCTPKDYWKLLTAPEHTLDFAEKYGNATFLMNFGVYGLLILGYYNAVGGTFNSITFGIIFCMLACANSGSHPGNVWPIALGYALSSLVMGGLSKLAGGSFAGALNAQAIMVGLCFANGLTPICDKFGWFWGMVSAIMHYLLVTTVPLMHGGYCLYNGGFTAALVCLLLVPQLEHFMPNVMEPGWPKPPVWKGRKKAKK